MDAATANGLERFREKFDRVFALSGGKGKATKGYKGCVCRHVSIWGGVWSARLCVCPTHSNQPRPPKHQPPSRSRAFTPAEVEAAQAAFSNMIGGVGFFQGRTSIKAEGGVLEVRVDTCFPIDRCSRPLDNEPRFLTHPPHHPQ